MFDLIRLTKSY